MYPIKSTSNQLSMKNLFLLLFLLLDFVITNAQANAVKTSMDANKIHTV